MEALSAGSRLADRLAQLNSVNNNVSRLREKRLALQAKPKSTDYDVLLPMVRASKKQDQVDGPWKKELETAIEGGRNVNFVNEATGKTILHDACAECSIEVVAFLLRSGSDPSVVTRQNRSTLYYAALNKDPRVAERILAFSSDPHARMIERDNQQMTPFDMACLNANGLTAEWLYSQYPKKELEKSRRLDPTQRTTLHLLLTGSTATELQLKQLNDFIKVILSARPSYIWRRDIEGRTPLSVHVQNHYKDATLLTFDVVLASLGSQEMVDTALYMLSNLKWKQKGPYKPEKWLILQQLCLDPQFAKFLPASIAHVSDRALLAQDPAGRSILHWFALYGHNASFVEQLVDLYRDYDKPDKHWRHPLGLDMPPPTKYGSKVSFFNSCCWSALLRRDAISAAVEKMRGNAFAANHSDSPLRIVDNNQDTPLHIAAKFNNAAAVESLESMFPGEGKTWKDAKGRNALHIAAANDSGAAIASLVHTVKCDIEERDGAGFTPLMIALRDNQDISVGVLLQLKAISQGISSTDGTSVEHLLEGYDKHSAEERELKEEKRRARLAELEAEEAAEEEEDDIVVKSDSPAADNSDINNDETGSVEYNGSDNGSVNSMEEHDSGDEIASPVANGKFRPTIKRDSEYDDEEASRGDESPTKPIIFKNGSGGQSTRAANGRVLARNPRVKLTPTDDYSHSSDEDETGSTGSVEIHSDSAESPPTSPRSENSLPSPRSLDLSPKIETKADALDLIRVVDSSVGLLDYISKEVENGNHYAELERRVRELEESLKHKQSEAEKRVRELEDALKLKEAQIEDRNKKLKSHEEAQSSLSSSLNSDLETSKSENLALSRQLDELKAELALSKSQNAEQALSSSGSQTTLDTLKSVVAASQAENASLTKEVDALKAELALSKSQTEEQALASSGSQTALDSTKNDLVASKTENAALTKEVDGLKAELALSQSQNEKLSASSRSDEESQLKLQELEKELASSQKSLAVKSEELDNLMRVAKSSADETERLNESLNQSTTRIELLERDLAKVSANLQASSSTQDPEQHMQSTASSSEHTLTGSQHARSQARRNIHTSSKPSSSWTALPVAILALFILALFAAFLAILGPYNEPQPMYHFS